MEAWSYKSTILRLQQSASVKSLMIKNIIAINCSRFIVLVA